MMELSEGEVGFLERVGWNSSMCPVVTYSMIWRQSVQEGKGREEEVLISCWSHETTSMMINRG